MPSNVSTCMDFTFFCDKYTQYFWILYCISSHNKVIFSSQQSYQLFVSDIGLLGFDTVGK